MKKLKLTLLALFCLLSYGNTLATTLTDDEKEEISERAIQKVNELQDYLSFIVNSDLRMDQRVEAVGSAMKLFIGEGQPYVEFDAYGAMTKHRAPYVELSYVSGIRKKSVGKYLKDLLTTYKAVENVSIESGSIVKISSITKGKDGKYYALASFSQKFTRTLDHTTIIDIDSKTVKIEITPIEAEGETIWEIRLGDIKVVESKHIR